MKRSLFFCIVLFNCNLSKNSKDNARIINNIQEDTLPIFSIDLSNPIKFSEEEYQQKLKEIRENTKKIKKERVLVTLRLAALEDVKTITESKFTDIMDETFSITDIINAIKEILQTVEDVKENF